MRFINFINESTDISEVANLIKKDCKPFLKDLGIINLLETNLLYSGRESIEIFFKRNVRKNRKPLDMPLNVHEVLDQMFFEKFKIKARSQSLFVTTNLDVAKNYGLYPFAIFPIGSYKIIWSSQIDDLYWWLNNHEKLDEISYFKDKTNDEIKEAFNKIKLMSKYKIGNLKAALKNKIEMMVYCDSYYAIRVHKLLELQTEFKKNE